MVDLVGVTVTGINKEMGSHGVGASFVQLVQADKLVPPRRHQRKNDRHMASSDKKLRVGPSA